MSTRSNLIFYLAVVPDGLALKEGDGSELVNMGDVMFDSAFEVYLADTEEARQLHFQIRYKVYCIDTGFEDPAAHVVGEERDSWDETAVPFLVREKASDDWVATMRLILPTRRRLPIEELCRLVDRPEIVGSLTNSCELSRLCVVKRLRGRRRYSPIQEGGGPDSRLNHISDGLIRRSVPEIVVGLFRAALVYTEWMPTMAWYLLITPALARIINRLGISLEQTGKAIDYRGTRIPYVVNPQVSRQQAEDSSTLLADILNRKALAYRPYSELELGKQRMVHSA